MVLISQTFVSVSNSVSPSVMPLCHISLFASANARARPVLQVAINISHVPSRGCQKHSARIA